MFRQQRRPKFQPQLQQAQQKNGLDKVSTSLDTFQQVLEVVHSTAPYIEKYGPVVQKIPSMYRMYKAIKTIDDTPSPTNITAKEVANKEEISTNESPNTLPSGYPSPRLYI